VVCREKESNPVSDFMIIASKLFGDGSAASRLKATVVNHELSSGTISFNSSIPANANPARNNEIKVSVFIFRPTVLSVASRRRNGVGVGLHDRGWRGLDGLAIGKMNAADGEDLFRDDTRGLHWRIRQARNRAL